MSRVVEPRVKKAEIEFLKFLLKNKGNLRDDKLDVITLIEYNQGEKINLPVFLKLLPSLYYFKSSEILNEFSEEEKKELFNLIEKSPWFFELNISLKYPRRKDIIDFANDGKWQVYLLSDRRGFLIYENDKYLRQLDVDYEVNDFDVYKNFLVVLDNEGNLRVIYIYSLKEVYRHSNKDIVGVINSDGKLILIYNNDTKQLIDISEIGEIGFRDIVKVEIVKSKNSFKELITLEGHSFRVSSISFSSDGKYLASGSYDKTIKIWDTESWKEIITLKGHPESISFSPDSKYLASGSDDKTIKIWEVGTWKLITTLKKHSDAIFSVSFSHCGRYLASGGADTTIKIWEVGTWNLITTLKGHSNDIYSLSFSPNGKYLASASRDGTIKIWEVENWKLIKTLTGHSNSVLSLSFSPNGKYLASGSWDNTIKIWEVGTWKLIITLEGHSDGIFSVSFSPDGGYLASSSRDKKIKIWKNYPTFKKPAFRHLIKGLYYLYIKPYLIVYCDDNYLRIWFEDERGNFRFLDNLCKVSEIGGNFKEIKDFEFWVVDNEFIIFKDNKVCGSVNFKNHINVLLGGFIEAFENFKNFVSLGNLKEVIK
ncbi:MAG: WD40 repeat domain-containing protein [candidate division WOR-3 bacterium]